jgi:hypothetical protein
MSEPTLHPESESRPGALNEVTTREFDPLFFDPLIEAFKKDVDRTLLRENLKLTTQQRSEKFLSFAKAIYELRGKANPHRKVWR